MQYAFYRCLKCCVINRLIGIQIEIAWFFSLGIDCPFLALLHKFLYKHQEWAFFSVGEKKSHNNHAIYPPKSESIKIRPLEEKQLLSTLPNIDISAAKPFDMHRTRGMKVLFEKFVSKHHAYSFVNFKIQHKNKQRKSFRCC